MRKEKEPPRALRIAKKAVRCLLVQSLICVMLLACVLGARFVSPSSEARIKSVLAYSIDFGQPVESVMQYADLFTQDPVQEENASKGNPGSENPTANPQPEPEPAEPIPAPQEATPGEGEALS